MGRGLSCLALQWTHVSRNRISVPRCRGCPRSVGRQGRPVGLRHFHRRRRSIATARAPLRAICLGCLGGGLLWSRIQGSTCGCPLRFRRRAAARAGAFPRGHRFTLLQTLDATHLASGQVGLDAGGFVFKMHLEVIPAQGVAKWLIRAAVKGFISWHPRAPTFFQLNHPMVVALVRLGARRGQEIAGGQVAIRLRSIRGHLLSRVLRFLCFHLCHLFHLLVHAVHVHLGNKQSRAGQ
mmetsp:Transcript_87609/g.107378  ORF Transcript_87609/g.107378 Transcript_87609/m.107378 type:complete len:237 (-) Transcript_87609:28-738(-)